jgi:hypothetical protein
MDAKQIEYFKSTAQSLVDQVARNSYNNAEQIIRLIREWEKVFLEESVPSQGLLQSTFVDGLGEVWTYMDRVINNPARKWNKELSFPAWGLSHPVIKALILPKWRGPDSGIMYLINEYLGNAFEEATELQPLLNSLYALGWKDEEIIPSVCLGSENPFYATFPVKGSWRQTYQVPDGEKKISLFGQYVLPLLPAKKGFLGLGKEEGYKKTIDELYSEKGHRQNLRIYWVSYLADFYPEGLVDCEREYLKKQEYQSSPVQTDFVILHILINKDTVRYENLALEIAREPGTPIEMRFSIYHALNKTFNGKYDAQITEVGEKHFQLFQTVPAKDHYVYDPNTFEGPLLNAYTDYLSSRSVGNAAQRVTQFIDGATFVLNGYLRYLREKWKEQSIPWLLTALFKDPQYIGRSNRHYYSYIFDDLAKYDLRSSIDKIIEFSVTLADKKTKLIVAKLLSKYPEEIIPLATALLSEKTTDQRVTGAMILAAINTPQTRQVLDEAVDQETNDDTRDIILESLQQERFAKPMTDQEVSVMIDKADKRKKLSRWGEKLIPEENVPALYWKSSGKQLTEKEIRFLFYRMKRSKSGNSDIEARQVLPLLDHSQTSAFAKVLVAAFQESNADSKLKYYLTFGGLLGDDEMMHNLHMLFKKNIADKRVKMAESVVGALAMVGTDKALRIVESIYRKYANKKPAISAAAKDALVAAATEQNITMEELGDRIIPNFDFDGLYRSIDIEGHAYRAFVGVDFKINFFSEDNKLRKSLPSNASKELKTEIKEMEKEINDVIKTQPGRLEKCMLDSRRWNVEQWNSFFYNHPIMFVYATKLLWGTYDEQGKLHTIFHVTPNAELFNINDEEVSLDDNLKIGIIHPTQLTEDQVNAWKDKVYQSGFTTLFEILDRPVFVAPEEEKEKSSSRRFFEQVVPKGADFVNTFLVKRNWHKGNGDGGRSEFTKTFNANLRAYANIDGPAVFYQGGTAPAKVFEIYFQGTSWSEKVFIKDVPPIFYSEVLADIDLLIKA